MILKYISEIENIRFAFASLLSCFGLVEDVAAFVEIFSLHLEHLSQIVLLVLEIPISEDATELLQL